MKEERLYVYSNENLVGVLKRSKERLLSFSYEKTWVKSQKSFPISPAMPLEGDKEYGHGVTLAYFENLLPEGNNKDRINKEERNIANSSFDFLKKYGEDCAGALAITKNANYVQQTDPHEAAKIAWQDIDKAFMQGKELYSYLQKKYKGRLSLAGAQDKIAIIKLENQVYLPTKGGATTHIMKPPIKRFGNSIDTVFNEFYCMRLAKSVGLKVAETSVYQSQYPYYFIKRFDRRVDEEEIVQRIHQIDFCQAQGVEVNRKYEENGGPSLVDNYKLITSLAENPVKDLKSFVDWLCFNLIIGNHDSHSKNLAFIKKNNKYELSPFYDILCTTVYRGLTKDFSFGFGKPGQRQFRWYKIRDYHIRALETQLNIKQGYLLETIEKMIRLLSKHKEKVRHSCIKETENYFIYKKIDQEISRRSSHLRKMLNLIK